MLGSIGGKSSTHEVLEHDHLLSVEMTIACCASLLGLACPQESFVDLARTEDGTRISAMQRRVSVGKAAGE